MKQRMAAYMILSGYLLALLAHPAPSQPSYPPLNLAENPEYTQALELAHTGQASEAIKRLLEIADRNTGTTLGAMALFKASEFTGSDETRRSLYQTIVARYTRSRFEIKAKLCLLQLTLSNSPRNNQARLEAYESLAGEFGGPTLLKVLSGREAVDQARVLPVESQQGIDAVYTQMGGVLQKMSRSEHALALANFRREAFLFDTGAIDDIIYLLVKTKEGSWHGFQDPTPVNPIVKILQPKPGQVKGPRPRVRFQTTVGDFTYPQVSISDVRVQLDGQDITEQLGVRSKHRRSLSTKPNSVFERLRFSFRPSHPLGRGDHTVSVAVPVRGYTGTGPGMARVSWSFRVGRDPDDDDDECSEDELDRDGWEKQD